MPHKYIIRICDLLIEYASEIYLFNQAPSANLNESTWLYYIVPGFQDLNVRMDLTYHTAVLIVLKHVFKLRK